MDLPSGGIKTEGGQILLRTAEKKQTGREIGDIVLTSRPDGTQVRVHDVANVVDGFEDSDNLTRFNGERAAMIQVYRVGDETPVKVAAAVRRYIETATPGLPKGVSLAVWKDQSRIFKERVELLERNGKLGLILVLVVLALFLEFRLAFWVTMGIPISVLGAFLFLPQVDVSVNMISLFAFIVTLGIVVDDAIVVGESAFEKYRTNPELGRLGAAIKGAQEVAQPVIFSIVTTLVAFAPMLFVPGASGQFFRNIPLVVFVVLLISLVESLLILPAHVGHLSSKPNRIFAAINKRQSVFLRFTDWLVAKTYTPTVTAATRRPYLCLAIAFAVLCAAVSFPASGRLGFTFMPKIDGDQVNALLEMPFGTPVAETERVTRLLNQTAVEALEDVRTEEDADIDTHIGVLLKVGSWESQWSALAKLIRQAATAVRSPCIWAPRTAAGLQARLSPMRGASAWVKLPASMPSPSTTAPVQDRTSPSTYSYRTDGWRPGRSLAVGGGQIVDLRGGSRH